MIPPPIYPIDPAPFPSTYLLTKGFGLFVENEFAWYFRYVVYVCHAGTCLVIFGYSSPYRFHWGANYHAVQYSSHPYPDTPLSQSVTATIIANQF